MSLIKQLSIFILFGIINAFNDTQTNCDCNTCIETDSASVGINKWYGFSCPNQYNAYITDIRIATTDGSTIDVKTKDSINSQYYYTFGSSLSVTCMERSGYLIGGNSSTIGILIKCDNIIQRCPYKYDIGSTCIKNIPTPIQTPTPIPIITPIITPLCDFKLISPQPNAILQIGHYYNPDWETTNCDINEILVKFVGYTDSFIVQKNVPFAIYNAPHAGIYKFELYNVNILLGTYSFNIIADSCTNLASSECSQKKDCVSCNDMCVGNAVASNLGCKSNAINTIIISSVCGIVFIIIIIVIITLICHLKHKKRNIVCKEMQSANRINEIEKNDMIPIPIIMTIEPTTLIVNEDKEKLLSNNI